MKVLVVHNHYRQPGGEQVAVEAHVDLLRRNGHQVVVYARHNHEIDGYGLRDKMLFFPRTLFSRPVYRELTLLVRRERPDLAHVHNVFPLISPAAYAALHAAGLPLVQTIHNFRLLCPNALFYTHGRICERCLGGQTGHAVRWRCYRDSYSLSALYALTIGWHRRSGTFDAVDRFIALTPFAADKLAGSGLVAPERISVLGNFLADPLPAAGPAERGGYVLFLGRLSSEKGLSTLLQAAAQVPEIQVKVAGDGPLATACRDQARTLGAANVDWLGHVAGEAKWSLLRNATALVVPSVCYEQLPFVVLESMATATPVVASRLGSLAGLVGDGESGLLFAPGDARDLADKLRRLWRDSAAAAAMGAKARTTVEYRWSVRAHYQGLLEVYAAAQTFRRARRAD